MENSSYIVTATDTNVGKTVVAAGLMLALKARYWKPVQSGRDSETGHTDTETVRMLTGLGDGHFFPEVYRLSQPLSPHRAAELDSINLEPEKILAHYKNYAGEPLVIEGAGGLMVPITRELLQIDLFTQMQTIAPAPIIVVARTALGTINHTLLSLAAIRARALTLAGIIFTGPDNPDNVQTILDFAEREGLAARNLGWLPVLDVLTPQNLRAAFDRHIAKF